MANLESSIIIGDGSCAACAKRLRVCRRRDVHPACFVLAECLTERERGARRLECLRGFLAFGQVRLQRRVSLRAFRTPHGDKTDLEFLEYHKLVREANE